MKQEVIVQFSVKAHAQVVGLIPSRGRAGGSQSMILSHHGCFYFSLPLLASLKSIKIYFKRENCSRISHSIQGVCVESLGSGRPGACVSALEVPWPAAHAA